MSTANVAKIANRIEEILEIENPIIGGTMLRTFFRVRLIVDVNNPLPTWFWVPRRLLPKAWAFLKFEKLQSLCYKCGVIGHK